MHRNTSRRVEELIAKYTFNLHEVYIDDETSDDDFLLLRSDFQDLVNDLRSINISGNYLGLMSWLLDRAFLITPNIRSNRNTIKTTLDKNKVMLLKVLYNTNKDTFLKCFVQSE